MQISKENLGEFKRFYKKRFHEDIFDQETSDKATKLLNLMRIVYKPMTQKEYDALQKRRGIKETQTFYI